VKQKPCRQHPHSQSFKNIQQIFRQTKERERKNIENEEITSLENQKTKKQKEHKTLPHLSMRIGFWT